MRFFAFLIAMLLPVGAYADRYAVEAGSRLAYDVVHPMHKVHGVSERVQGEFYYDANKPLDFAGVIGKPVQANWSSFNSGNSNRDTNMLSVVNAQEFPTVTFVIEGIDQPAQTGTTLTGEMRGRLYINGVRQPVRAPVQIDLSNPKALRVMTKFGVKMSHFKLERPSLLFVQVEDGVDIDVNLVLQLVER